jgi:hypothetical protein
VGSGGITRVFPDLSDDLLLNLFHKGAKAQWTSRDLDWGAKTGLTSRQKLALARLLTPVYFGEQTAMAGAGSILPQVMAAGETTAQLYLASFIMDEARHFETLTRLYRSLGHDPLGLREIPELLRYHHRIRQGDRADWVWGILFSDVIAKHFYRAFGVNQTPGDPLFGGLSTRILQDESRHLAFAEHYLRRNVATMEPARRRALIDMRRPVPDFAGDDRTRPRRRGGIRDRFGRVSGLGVERRRGVWHTHRPAGSAAWAAATKRPRRAGCNAAAHGRGQSLG